MKKQKLPPPTPQTGNATVGLTASSRQGRMAPAPKKPPVKKRARGR